MKTLMELLNADTRISDYKINLRSKESYELFFVKGALETLRCTDTCDKEVTVYVNGVETTVNIPAGGVTFYCFSLKTGGEFVVEINPAE